MSYLQATYYQKQRNVIQGVRVVNQAIGALVRDKEEGIRFSPKSLSKCHLLRAQLFLAGGEAEQALQDIVEVLKVDPRDFSALCVKAKCMFMKGEFEKSLVIWHHVNMIRAHVAEVGPHFKYCTYHRIFR